MKAPKCSVCGSEHWSGEPHRFPKGSMSNPASYADFDSTRPSAPSQPPITGRAMSGVGTQPGQPIHMPPLVGTQDQTEVAALKTRIAELEAEVAKLKAAADLTERRRKSNREKMAARRAGDSK